MSGQIRPNKFQEGKMFKRKIRENDSQGEKTMKEKKIKKTNFKRKNE